MQRVEVTFQGHVQGVGFRYTTMEIAKGFPVTGFVRNEPNGSVFLTAEGDRDSLDQFLSAILDRMQDFIHAHHVTWSAATNHWTRFQIER
jgi:acylphosphatase